MESSPLAYLVESTPQMLLTREIFGEFLPRKTNNAFAFRSPMQRGSPSHPRVTSVNPTTRNVTTMFTMFLWAIYFPRSSKTCKPHEISGETALRAPPWIVRLLFIVPMIEPMRRSHNAIRVSLHWRGTSILNWHWTPSSHHNPTLSLSPGLVQNKSSAQPKAP